MPDGPDFIPYQEQAPEFIPYHAETAPPPSAPPPPPAAKPDLSGPTHTAARRNAQAQPGITPAVRAADPVNQAVTEGLKAMPGVVAMGAGSALAAPAAGLMGAYGAIAPVAGAALGGAAEESAEQVAGAAGRKIAGQPTGTPDYGAVRDKAITGAEGEMGSQIIGKTLDVAGNLVQKGESALGKGVDALKQYFSIGGPSTPPAAGPASLPEETAPVAPERPAAPAKPVPTGKLVTDAMNEQFGVKPLPPNQPIVPRPTVMAGSPAVNEALEQPAAGPRIQTPSRNETLLENMKNRVPGSNPLEPDVPLGEQKPSAERPAAPPKSEDVHPMDRQIIHSDGASVLEATKGKPTVLEDLHALENNQLREVLRKSGEDMGNHIVTSASKTMDPEDYTRQEAFEILLKDKKYTPEQILKEAPPRSKPAKARVPFGPKR